MRGQLAKGNIVGHSRKERRYRCLCCGHTFAQTKGTPFYRLHTQQERVILAVTLLAHGCPLPAIVVAFGCDERTAAAWQERAGDHAARVHQATVQQGQVELEHVQADELWVKTVGRKLWLALALAVPSRLWLGGVLSGSRDGELIADLVAQVRRCARRLGILVCVDGLASYVTAFCRAFRVRVPTVGWRRPRWELAPGFLLGQVIKRYAGRRLTEVEHRAICGTREEVAARVQESRGGRGINTAFIERLNATFRSRLAALVRRGRCLLRQDRRLEAAIYLVGTIYNFCSCHDSLRVPLPLAVGSRQWQARTPAMAAGLTDHCWSAGELLHYRIPPPPWRPPKRLGRKPKEPVVWYWKLRPKRVISLSTV